MWTGLIAVVLAALAGPGRAADDDLARLVERLAAPTAAERWRAERELGQALGPGDRAALVAAIEAAGTEQRLRIAAALGARDEHVGLAAELAADLRRRPREVGEWALAGALGRWRPGLQTQPISGEPLSGALEREAAKERTRRFRVPFGAGLVTSLDALGQAARPPVPIVVDPALRGAPSASPGGWPALEGSWVELLAELVATRAVGLDAAFAMTEAQPNLVQLVYVRLTRPELVALDPPDAQVTRWMRDSLSDAGPVAARGARALGECGWPAALDWLGERWIDRADPAALAGLVVAARRGHVAPALLDRGRYAELCRALAVRLDALGGLAVPAAGGPLTHVDPAEVAAALGHAGARLADGSPALDVLLAGAGPDAPRWTHLALGVVGELGVADQRLRSVVTRLLDAPPGELDDAAAGELGRAALDTWGRTVGAEPPAPRPRRAAAILATVRGLEDGRALLRSILRCGAAAPTDLAAADGSETARLVAVAWLVADGRFDRAPGAAAAELAALAGRPAAERERRIEHLAVLLRDLTLDRAGAVDQLLALLRSRPDVERVASELAARVGRLEAAAHGGVLAGATEAAGAAGVATGLLTALATGPVGRRAQDLLVERLEAEVADPGLHDPDTVPALGAVVRALLAAERDGEALALRARIRRAVRADVRSPAARAVLDGTWPGAPGLEPEVLGPPRGVPIERLPGTQAAPTGAVPAAGG